jgi:hypothetical protein
MAMSRAAVADSALASTLIPLTVKRSGAAAGAAKAGVPAARAANRTKSQKRDMIPLNLEYRDRF